MACIEKSGEIYCNPRCDLPQELQCKFYLANTRLVTFAYIAYPDHLKPDVLVKHESEYMNVLVYIAGTISTIFLLGM